MRALTVEDDEGIAVGRRAPLALNATFESSVLLALVEAGQRVLSRMRIKAGLCSWNEAHSSVGCFVHEHAT